MLAVVHARGRVGTLRQDGHALTFAYDDRWLARGDSFALSPRLPLREQPWTGDEPLFFFANLLPEGNLLDVLCRLRRLPHNNVYRLLEAFGRECAGAFEIVPEQAAGEPREPAWRPYLRAELVDDLARLRDNVPLLAQHAELRLSMAGAQNKIPVRFAEGELWLPQGGAPSTHLLKPSLQPQAIYQDAVLNEAFCLRLGSALGLDVPNVTVLRDPEPCLLIERYDRRVHENGIERLHQLDLCQLAGVLPDQKYEADGGPGLHAGFAALDAHSALPAADRLRLVDRVVFNYLIGNADAHAKNLSMLAQADGRLRLAPAYDLLATGYWPEVSDRMAMAIGGERRPDWVMARHWQCWCADAGLNVLLLRRRALALCAAARARCAQVLEELDAPAALARHATATLERRGTWIEQRLKEAQG